MNLGLTNKIIEIIVSLYMIIILADILLNILVLIVFSSKKFRNTVFWIYFRFVAIFQILAVLIPINKILEFNFNIYVMNLNDFFCKLRVYYFNVLFPINGWMMVVISIDRFLIIAFPTRFLIRKKTSFQIFVCFGILLYNLIYYAPSLLSKINETSSFVNKTNQTNLEKKCVVPVIYPYDLVNTLNSTIITFTLMFLFTILSIRIILKSRKTNQNQTKRTKNIRFSIITIALTVIFLGLNIPYTIYVILLTYLPNMVDQTHKKLIFSLINFASYSNLVSSFFTNFIFNKIFRKELKKKIKLFKNYK